MGHIKNELRHNPHKCEDCIDWYDKVIRYTEKLDSPLRERLLNLWKILWTNNCGDFDIIYYEFVE